MFIQTPKVRFHLEARQGGGPTLVLLHFFGGAGSSWAPMLDELGEFQSYAPDLRGFGDSSAAPENYSVEAAANDVAALIAALDLGEFVLCGHSMGGKIALRVAATRPRRLRALLLFAPSPPTPEPMSNEVREMLRASLGVRARAETVVRGAAGGTLPEKVFALAVENELRATPDVWNAWLDVGSREDISGLMAQIEVPTLVVAGAHDGGMTPELLNRELVARLSNARLETLDAGHLVPISQPQACAQLLREFIAKN